MQYAGYLLVYTIFKRQPEMVCEVKSGVADNFFQKSHYEN